METAQKEAKDLVTVRLEFTAFAAHVAQPNVRLSRVNMNFEQHIDQLHHTVLCLTVERPDV